MTRQSHSNRALRAVLVHCRAMTDCREVVLVDPSNELPQMIDGISGLTISVMRYEALTRKAIAALQTEVILAPLLTDTFDILDLAIRLEEAEFTGALRAYSTYLPNLRGICREVRADHPTLDFDIFEIPEDPAHAS